MKWLVIIELRSVGDRRNILEKELKKLIEELHNNTGQQIVKIYNHVAIESDFSIHLLHESDEADINKSPLALQLVSALKEFGLINYSVWIERFDS